MKVLGAVGIPSATPQDRTAWRKFAVDTILGFAASFAVLFAIWPLINHTGAEWERTWLVSIHRWVRGDIWLFFYYLGEFGRKIGVTVVTVACVLWWFLRGDRWKAALLFFNAAMLYFFSPVTGLGSSLGLHFFAAPRPDLFPNHRTYPELVSTFGYPSGHGLLAFAFYGFIVFLALHGAPRRLRIAGWILWAVGAVALGFSRLVLSDHWPTQVLAGYASGACILIGMATGARQWLRSKRPNQAPLDSSP